MKSLARFLLLSIVLGSFLGIDVALCLALGNMLKWTAIDASALVIVLGTCLLGMMLGIYCYYLLLDHSPGDKHHAVKPGPTHR